MTPQGYDFLTNITSGILAISVIVGICHFNKIKSLPLRCLIIYLTFGTLVDVSLFVFEFPDRFLRGIYCITLPVEYIIYVLMFKSFIEQNSILRLAIVLSAVSLSAFGVYQLIFNLPATEAGTVVFRVMGILTMILVLLYFHSLLTTTEILILTQEPLFWVATCLLVFFTVNIVPTGFYHLFYSHSHESAPNIFLINILLNALRYAVYGKAFLIAAKNRNGR